VNRAFDHLWSRGVIGSQQGGVIVWATDFVEITSCDFFTSDNARYLGGALHQRFDLGGE